MLHTNCFMRETIQLLFNHCQQKNTKWFFLWARGEATAVEKDGRMSDMNVEEHYSMLLGLTSPWTVVLVEMNMKRLRIDVYVEWRG